MLSLIILFLLIVLNGLFVMAEIALVSARKSKLEDMAAKGDHQARAALKLAEKPESCFRTAQIGITLVAILTGFYSGEKFGSYLKPLYRDDTATQKVFNQHLHHHRHYHCYFFNDHFRGTDPEADRTGSGLRKNCPHCGCTHAAGSQKITYPIVLILNGTSNLFFKIFPVRPSADSNVLRKMKSRRLLMKEPSREPLTKPNRRSLNAFFTSRRSQYHFSDDASQRYHLVRPR